MKLHGNSRLAPRNYFILPLSEPRGLVLKSLRHGDVTPAPVPGERGTSDLGKRRWLASYTDANGKRYSIGLFDTQEQAAHAVNAAIRRAGLEGRRKANPVVDGRNWCRKCATHRNRCASAAARRPPPRRRRAPAAPRHQLRRLEPRRDDEDRVGAARRRRRLGLDAQGERPR